MINLNHPIEEKKITHHLQHLLNSKHHLPLFESHKLIALCIMKSSGEVRIM